MTVSLKKVIALALCLVFAMAIGVSADSDSSINNNNLRGNEQRKLKLGNSPEMHGRPICADSTLFRAKVDGVLRNCAWVANKAARRCESVSGWLDEEGGVLVLAKYACFEACGTGNCRRQ